MNKSYHFEKQDQINLWRRLVEHSFDQEGYCQLSFRDRLCRENNWNADYADGAILEYKKFIFLVIFSGHGATPSDEVDQVWHLHLQYSYNYWVQFCGEILGQQVHHGPTKGGKNESEKYQNYYQKTLESYLKYFGQRPLHIYWPDSKTRFEMAPYFRRINTKETLIINFGPILKIVDAIPYSALLGIILLGISYLTLTS